MDISRSRAASSGLTVCHGGPQHAGKTSRRNKNGDRSAIPPSKSTRQTGEPVRRDPGQQATWLKNIAPALASMRAAFCPPNLRSIEGLKFEEVEQVVMAHGIPLCGLPRLDRAGAGPGTQGEGTAGDLGPALEGDLRRLPRGRRGMRGGSVRPVRGCRARCSRCAV